MKISQFAEARAATKLPIACGKGYTDSLTAVADNHAALQQPRTDTFTQANDTPFTITGIDWSYVATLEFPLFSGRLSILVS